MKTRTRGLVAVGLLTVCGALALFPSAPVSNPLTGLSRPAPGASRFVATVEERLSAGSYHYLRVRPSGREPEWVVATRAAELGQQLDVEVFGISTRFTSARLSRVFSPLSFATIHPHQEHP